MRYRSVEDNTPDHSAVALTTPRLHTLTFVDFRSYKGLISQTNHNLMAHTVSMVSISIGAYLCFLLPFLSQRYVVD